MQDRRMCIEKAHKYFLWQILNSHMNVFTVSFEKSYKQYPPNQDKVSYAQMQARNEMEII